jgi:hypothetical protein
MDKVIRAVLVAKINGLADQAQYLRNKMRKVKKPEQANAMCRAKHFVGEEARHHLLAYAFLRNMPYKAVEPSCRKDNKPIAQSVFTIVQNTYRGYVYRLEQIKEWLGENTEHLKDLSKETPVQRTNSSAPKSLLARVMEGLGL